MTYDHFLSRLNNDYDYDFNDYERRCQFLLYFCTVALLYKYVEVSNRLFQLHDCCI